MCSSFSLFSLFAGSPAIAVNGTISIIVAMKLAINIFFFIIFFVTGLRLLFRFFIYIDDISII